MNEPKASILIVDDEYILVNQLEELLCDSGFTVAGTASSGTDAIDLARSLKPDLALICIAMPGEIDGIAACEAIQHALDIPVVMLTAYSAPSDIARPKQFLPYGYVLKPYQDRQLIATIELALAAKDRERGLRAASNAAAQLRSHANVQMPLDLQLKEIHHRIKNQLNMVYSFIDFQSRHLSDPEGLAVMREIKSRIAAISHIHQQIYSSKDLESVDSKEYFAMLEKSLRYSYALPATLKLALESGSFIFDSQRMLFIGLIITEFVSNSLKHGFPGLSCGDIHVSLQKTGAGYILMLSDSGVGLPHDFDFSNLKTFGLQILSGMVEQLHGKLQIVDGLGTAFLIVFAT